MSEKVLICDDDRSPKGLVRCALENGGYNIVMANDGIKALELAHEQVPDLILLDIMVPGKRGYDTCRTFKFDSETRNVPIMVLANSGVDLDRKWVREIQPDYVVVKPFSYRELCKKIQELFD